MMLTLEFHLANELHIDRSALIHYSGGEVLQIYKKLSDMKKEQFKNIKGNK